MDDQVPTNEPDDVKEEPSLLDLPDDAFQSAMVIKENEKLGVNTGSESNEDSNSEPSENINKPDSVDFNYEEAYKKISQPFKANGQMVEFKDPDEIIGLMQKGIDYTKKMQSISGQRKLIKMLESNQIDENKLSFLIDLNKNNPEAIQKFFKETGLDPLDVDINAQSQYQQGKHLVSDAEMAFNGVLEELMADELGQKTISTIHSNWDESSKQVLWESPAIMKVIQEQMGNGVYETITQEMTRQNALGMLPAGTPFLQAYKYIGDQLLTAKTANTQATETKNSIAATEKRVVIQPKPQVSNKALVDAAATNKGGASRQASNHSILNLSDDEFMAEMKKRL